MRDLFFNIRAKDLTGAAFDKVKRGLATVDGAMAGLGDRADRIGQKLVGLGGVMAGVTGSLVMAFRDSLTVWDTQEQAMARVEQAVRRTGAAAGFTADELAGHADALSRVTRFGDQDILGQVTASLLTFGNVSGDVFTRAQEGVADMATVLGTDLQGLAMTLGEALNAPAEGLSALGEAGIVFTEGQTKLVEELVKTGNVAAAQGVILDEVARRFGGQARAAAEVGIGGLIQFQNVWMGLKETVGGVVASLLPPVTGFLTMVADGFQGLSEPVQRAIVMFVGTSAALGVLALAAGAAMIALAPLSLPFIAISAAIAGAITLIAAFWPEIQRAGRAVDAFMIGFAMGFADVLQSTADRVVAGVNHYISAFQGAFDAIKAIWSALPDSIGGIVTLAANAMIAGVEAMINGVIARINKLNEGVNAALSLLPEWATGEGGIRIEAIADVSLGRIDNPAADGAMQDAAVAYAAAFENPTFEAPQLFSDEWRGRMQGDLDALRAMSAEADGAAAAIDAIGASIVPVVPALGDTEEGAKGAAGGLSKVGKEAEKSKDKLGDLMRTIIANAHDGSQELEGFGRETSDMFKGLFNPGRKEFESFGDFAVAWGSKLLDRMLATLFDPLGDSLQALFDGKGAMPAGGGGGGFGGLLAGAGKFLGGLLPGFDTGGEMSVGGRAGIDRNVAAFRVTQGETIKVTKRGGDSGGGSSKASAPAAPAGGHLSIGWDASIGGLTATMRDIAGNVVAQSQPAIVGAAVGQVRQKSRQSKSFFNGR